MSSGICSSTFKLINAIFKNTSATYKFYWFWAIIEVVEEDKKTIQKHELFSRMVALAWYTVNYFQVSFGSQDLLQQAIYKIKEIEYLNIEATKKDILAVLLATQNKETLKTLNHFDKNVPHKFLSPWLGGGAKKEVYQKSTQSIHNTPYALARNEITVYDDWYSYFKNNSGVLKSYCYWHLSLFLQARNPNVPEIPNKILKPIVRKSLNQHKTLYWDLIIEQLGGLNCIYTGEKLSKGNYIIEHFIPHQFVAHDLMWNLIPAESSFNSSKSNKLPPFDKYFEDFYLLQKEGVQIIKSLKPKNKFLQDYLSIFPNLIIDKVKYEEHIKPMLTIAHNNGFQYLTQ
tara:strand:+ start:88 stop:1116 length:1029 start_codon:yes stop_codon:yes gene_type:complete